MELKALSNLSLLQKIREGDQQAFNVLFERYFNKLYKYTLHHTNNAPLAEELVMDLMLWIWNKKDSLEIKGDVSAYLHRAMKNAIYSHFRKKELLTSELEPEELAIEAYQTASSGVAMREVEQEYHISLALLTPQRRKIFKMSRDEDMSHSQIARDLNLSVKTVEAHLSASLRFMRQRFKDYADFILLVIITWIF